MLTKLDGSAKGGIVFAVETELGIPVKLVGIGESIEDLVPFDPDEFVDALSTSELAGVLPEAHQVALAVAEVGGKPHLGHLDLVARL